MTTQSTPQISDYFTPQELMQLIDTTIILAKQLEIDREIDMLLLILYRTQLPIDLSQQLAKLCLSRERNDRLLENIEANKGNG